MERSRVGLRKAREQLLPGTSLAALESLSLPLVQEIILSADVQCAVCEKRLAEIMSKMKDMESVVVNVLEKKVTLIYRYSSAVKEPSWSRQVAAILYKNLNHTGKQLHQPFMGGKLSVANYASTKYCCMMLRINIDCNACCNKVRRIVLSMKEVETHMIEKQEGRISVCGRFRPSDVAIKMRKKMKRRVEILEIQEFDDTNEETEQRQVTGYQ